MIYQFYEQTFLSWNQINIIPTLGEPGWKKHVFPDKYHHWMYGPIACDVDFPAVNTTPMVGIQDNDTFQVHLVSEHVNDNDDNDIMIMMLMIIMLMI